MKILIINAGSSSIKFQLFEMDDESVIAKGTCHMIGLADPFIEYKAKGKELVKHLPMKDHTQALEVVLDMLVNSELKVINSFDEVAAVGHRCVQGGWLYSESVLITDEVIENLKQTKDISPLHAEANIAGMVGCRKVMPSTPQVVVFDTAFHATMPEKAFMYGIKYEDYQKYVDEMIEQYKLRRNYIVNGFNRIGLPTHLPHGAFYIFPCIKKTGLTSLEFCEKLLEEQNVACVPGSAFGEAGEGFIRVSYAYSLEELKIATQKIKIFVEKCKATHD